MLGLLIEKCILKNYDIKMYILYITAHKVAKKNYSKNLEFNKLGKRKLKKP